MKRGKKILTAVLIVAAFLLPFGWRTAEEGQKNVPAKSSGSLADGLEVHFLDVGQGDSTLIICGSHAMLLDAGENDRGTQVQLYLKKHGVESLDYVIGTHPDSDHIGGLDVILSKFDTGTVILPEYSRDTRTYRDVLRAMEEKGYRNTPPVVGERYQLGEADFTVIAPNRADYGEVTNNYSVGILLRYGENRFLFTGDAQEEAEEDLLANGINLSADVYKAGHHGSRTSSSRELLEAVRPVWAVISCGEDNSYGFPHAQTLNSLRALGIKVFRTDEEGTVAAFSDGKNITWNCSPTEEWKAGEPTGSTARVTYLLNQKSRKFHLPSCSAAQDMSDSNKLESDQSREELIGQGYEPCQKCSP